MIKNSAVKKKLSKISCIVKSGRKKRVKTEIQCHGSNTSIGLLMKIK